MHKLHRTNSELSICNIFCYFFTAFLHLTFSDVTFPAHMSLYFKGTKINYIFQVAISCINRFQTVSSYSTNGGESAIKNVTFLNFQFASSCSHLLFTLMAIVQQITYFSTVIANVFMVRPPAFHIKDIKRYLSFHFSLFDCLQPN